MHESRRDKMVFGVVEVLRWWRVPVDMKREAGHIVCDCITNNVGANHQLPTWHHFRSSDKYNAKQVHKYIISYPLNAFLPHDGAVALYDSAFTIFVFQG